MECEGGRRALTTGTAALADDVGMPNVLSTRER